MEEAKTEEPRFKCACCGMAVIVLDGEIIRACPHTDAAVTADCTATAYGESKLEN
jgi:hypothetical protein